MAALSMFGAVVALASPRGTLHPEMKSVFTKRTFFIGAPFVGNAGFDPLNLASDESSLVALRHAELKHGRLAMLAAVAWPVQELVHPVIVKELGCRDVLAGTHGCSPSIFVGGLDSATPVFFFALVLGALFEAPEVANRMKQGLAFNEYGLDSVAGDFQFDPLGLATDLGVTDRYELQVSTGHSALHARPAPPRAPRSASAVPCHATPPHRPTQPPRISRSQEAEMLNGRLAQLAVPFFAMLEASGTRVVDFKIPALLA